MKFQEFIKQGLLENRQGRLKLTPEGLYLSNSVFREIIG
jgi:coproporphyrinogen III oxidase-like Fe-S oxidoreductase